MHYHADFDHVFGGILAECEPSAPPKPKFAVDEVVFDLALGMPHKIAVYADGVYIMTDLSSWPETRLRPLTPEEKGSA